MNMNATDCTTYQEWLDLELDGDLPAARAASLAGHLGGCAACRAERQELARLRDRLAGGRVDVRAGFRADVMAALPAAGWEARSPRAWRLPLALFALLAGAAAVLAGVSTAQLHRGAPFLAALGAVADLMVAAALAGAGLLGASWSGVGLAFGEIFVSSKGTLAAFAGLVVGLNLVLFLLLRRRPAAVKSGAVGRERRRRDG
jgi:predicted anti-sigma-YlaC factor YlaD